MNYKMRYKNVLSFTKQELKACGSLVCDAAKQIFNFSSELKESEYEGNPSNLTSSMEIHFGTDNELKEETYTIPDGFSAVIDGNKVVIKSNNFPKFIDLGLPSGTLWADRNLGANTPKEYGNYYRFGEVKPYTENSPEYDYIFDKIKGYPAGTSIAGTDKDAATVLLGKEYSMPTMEQIEELGFKCEWEWMEEDGIKGMKVTGPNGNSIFLPAGGQCRIKNTPGEFLNVVGCGYYWSASVCYGCYSHHLFIYPNKFDWATDVWECGCSIRAIKRTKN